MHVDPYLARLVVQGPLRPSHLRTIPFENLSIHLGEPIVLDPQLLVAKLVERYRGGFCYELNGAWLDEPYLADVGFGRSFLQPLRLAVGAPQADPAGRSRIAAAPDGELDLLGDIDGAWVPQYRFALDARALDEFVDACTYHQTSPESHFTRGSVCSIATESGRVTIQGSRLIVSTSTERVERELGDEELRAAYRDHFGILLDRLPPR